MKTKCRLLALVLIVLMTMALATPAFAATTGSITIENAANGQSYSVYKVFDLETTDGTAVTYTYTKKGTTDAFLTALQASGSPFTLTETSTAGVYDVTSSASGTAIAAFLTTNKSNLGSAAGTIASVTGNTAQFTGLDLGYYYITSSLGTTVTIDSTLPNVTVFDKNGTIDWDNDPDPTDDDDETPGKVIVLEDNTKVTANTAMYGDTVNFDIGITALNYDGTKKVSYYYIKDKLDAGFVQLTSAFAPVVKVGGTTLAKDINYTLTVDTTNNTFEIVIPWVVTAAGATQGDSLYDNLTEIHVTYAATVDTDAVVGETGNVNSAWFTYDTFDPETDTPDDPSDDPEYPDDPRKTTTYIYAIGLLKTDGTNPLGGAHFALKDGSDDPVNVTWDDTAKYYKIGGTSNEVVSGDDGEICIIGFDAGTYSLTETQAPSGYNKNTTPIVFTIETAVSEDDDTVEEFVKTVVFAAEFVNNAGTELPATGGIGTTLFITFGMIAMLCTGVFLVTNKRISKETF